jgi:hypothetical protein
VVQQIYLNSRDLYGRVGTLEGQTDFGRSGHVRALDRVPGISRQSTRRRELAIFSGSIWFGFNRGSGFGKLCQVEPVHSRVERVSIGEGHLGALVRVSRDFPSIDAETGAGGLSNRLSSEYIKNQELQEYRID